jgi:Tfp pilus assembly protein PilN
MIRINLLESITDKPLNAAVVVEKKISNPASRFWLLAAIVGGLLVLTIGFDYLTASSARAAADEELVKQKEISVKMEAVIKEQAELDKKIKDIDSRIDAIKNLRTNQAGPSAVLEALRERLGNTPGLYLESIEQKGNQLTITGNSPDEYVVTNFGRSLEFSSGLFSNLNIETQRKELQAEQASTSDNSTAPEKAPRTINFKIVCAYSPQASQASPLPNDHQTASNQSPSTTQSVPSTSAPQATKQ